MLEICYGTQTLMYFHLSIQIINYYNECRVFKTCIVKNLNNCIIENTSAKTNDDLAHSNNTQKANPCTMHIIQKIYSASRII